MSEICIFGGRFDPFHNGHLAIINSVQSTVENLDKIILIPTGKSPHKSTPTLLSNTIRLQCLEKICTHNTRCEISTFELNEPTTSWTINTIQHLKNQYPKHILSIVIGTDQFFKFHTWKDYKTLLKLIKVHIINREKTHDKTAINAYIDTHFSDISYTIALLSMTYSPISSTDIRHRLADNKPLKGLVPDSILRIIE